MSTRLTDVAIAQPQPKAGGRGQLLHVAETHAVADEWRWDRPCFARAPGESIHREFSAGIAATAATTPSEAA